MKIKKSLNAGLIINIIMCWTILCVAKSIAKDGEIEVKLQFLEYELEDFCVLKNEAEWKFLNGSNRDLKKFLEVEIKESDFYKHEVELLQKHTGKQFSHKRLQRLVDVFSHPGAPLLGSMEFKEYRDYSIKLQELVGTMKIQCSVNESTDSISGEILHINSSDAEENCKSIDYRKMCKVLFDEKNEEKLKRLWTKWYRTLEEKNKKTKYDFVQQLSILDLEAEQNGEEELTEYWLKQTDTTWINYETAKSLWKEISPLYEKLKQFLTSFVVQKFGKSVVREKMISAHVLGSLVSHDWLTAAQKLGAFDTSYAYKSLQHSLQQRKVEDLYKTADNQTAELKLGNLPSNFYEKSRFNVSSQTCQHKIMNYCERGNSLRAIFCADEVPNIRQYLQINENVIKMKHQLLSGKEEEEENGYLFREGPRESALHEAVEGLASIRALWPEVLESQELLTNQSQQQMTMLSLLITALHVIPPLPYYLAGDLWRINALREMDAIAGENADTTSLPVFSSTINNSKKREMENENGGFTKSSANIDDEESTRETEPSYNTEMKTYTMENLTRDWWNYRQDYQGISSPDDELYADYLRDTNIIWNKPYLSKFLGKILQFQILEKSKNLTTGLIDLQSMLEKGKSESWQNLVEDTFNISEISAAPLLKYFKPLEEFLDKGMKFKNSTQIFSFHDFNFVPQGFSLNPTSNEDEGEQPAEGSDALFFSLAVIAAVGVVAVIVTIGRRRYRRKQRARERKRRLAEF